MADRKSTTEMVADLRAAVEAQVEAKCWLDRATQKEQLTRCQLANAITDLEQRALQAPRKDSEGK